VRCDPPVTCHLGWQRVALAVVSTAVVVSLAAPLEHAYAQSLDATDPTEVGLAIAAAGHAGDRTLATALATRIDGGLPAPLLSRAIYALVSNGSPPAVSALLELCAHRRAAVRVHATQGLAHFHTPSARRVLADLLDDPDAGVRSAAAVALGEVGAQGFLDTVMLAAQRGVADAAILFGRQASATDVARLLRVLDVSSIEAMAPALRILIGRSEMSRPSRLAIVRRLGELGGPVAQQVLREAAATMSASDPIGHAIEAALAPPTGE